ncbi:hypothetical protein [Saccharopolyspora taberi]|uniref:hypothetical protein n=1 Tax=Saccharopolyspora taberi TaxID=60895 RepID=UPI0031D7C60D
MTVMLAVTQITSTPRSAQSAKNNAVTFRLDRTAFSAVPSDLGRETPAAASTMYGVFYEDINRAADGGLVRNRSFEYDPADNPGYTPLTAWEQPARPGFWAKSPNPVFTSNDPNRHTRIQTFERIPTGDHLMRWRQVVLTHQVED